MPETMRTYGIQWRGNIATTQGMEITPGALHKVTRLTMEATFMDNRITDIRRIIASIRRRTTKGINGQIRVLGDGMTIQGISGSRKATRLRSISIANHVTQ